MLLFLHLCACCGAGPQLLGPLLSIAFLSCSGPLLTASLPSRAPDASVSDWLLSFPHTPDSREGTCSPGHTNTRAPDGPVDICPVAAVGLHSGAGTCYPTPQPGGSLPYSLRGSPLHSLEVTTPQPGGFPFHSLGVPNAQPGGVLCMCISHLVWVLMGGHPVLDLSRPLTTPELSRQPDWLRPVH